MLSAQRIVMIDCPFIARPWSGGGTCCPFWDSSEYSDFSAARISYPSRTPPRAGFMSWWLPSWLPSLPSIDFALPSSIQRRFVSFALRRSLGHLFKPGQLDVQQIDSQIGSGYVQVRDLELNNDVCKHLPWMN